MRSGSTQSSSLVEPIAVREGEAAVILGVSPRQVGKWAYSGELPSVTYDGTRTRRFLIADIRAFAKRKLRPAAITVAATEIV